MGNSTSVKSRTGIYVLIGMASVFLLSIVGLYAYFSEDRLRELLVPVLESTTNRRVTLDKVGLRLWGGVEASVEGLAVFDRPGFGDSPFVTAGRASFSLAFMPLILGEAKLGEVIIENPSISVVINRKGEANYSDLQEESSSAESNATSGGEVLLQSVKIRNGVLRYEDRQQETVTSIDGLDYEAHGELRENKLRIEGRLSIEQVAHGSQSVCTSLEGLYLTHIFSIELGSGDATVESIEVGTGELNLKLRGWIRAVGDATQVMLEIPEKTLRMEVLSKHLTRFGVLTEGTRIQGGLTVGAKIEGAWAPDRSLEGIPSFSGGLVAEALTIETPDLLQPVKDLNVEVLLEDGVVSIERVSGTAGRSDFSVTGKVSGIMSSLMGTKPVRPLIAFSLQSKVMDLDELIPLEDQAFLPPASWSMVSPAFATSQSQSIPSPLPPLLRSLDVDGDLQFGELKSEGTVLKNFKAAVKSRKGVLEIHNIAAKVYGGTLSGQAELDVRKPGGRYPVKADISVDGAHAANLLKQALGWSVPLHGDLGMKLGFTGAVDSTLEVVYSHLNAQGKAGMNQGKIVNWGLLKRAASQVSQLGFLNFDEIPISGLVAPFKISNGRLVFTDVKFSAAGLDCSLSGSTGLDRNLDYILDVDLPPSRLNVGGLNLGSALGSFIGGGGPIPLRLKIGGTVTQPSVSPSFRPPTKTGRKAEEKKQDGLEEKAKGLFKKLF
jgi:uncharacterized protein involved in outer membrane biogenesis